MTETDTLDLDRLFLQARDQPPVPDAAFLGLVMRDAQAKQFSSRNIFRDRFAAICTRWATIGGFATAAVTGLWIGIGLPGDVTSYFSSTVSAADATDGAAQRTILLPDSDILALAGE